MHIITKYFSKKDNTYKTYAKSCNSTLYTKHGKRNIYKSSI